MKTFLETTLEFSTMGTQVFVSVVHQKNETFVKECLHILERICEEKVSVFNRFDPNSEISQVNKKLEQWILVSTDMLTVAWRCLEYWHKSEGYFDPRILQILHAVGYSASFPFTATTNSLDMPSPQLFETPLHKDLRIRDKKICFLTPMDFSGIAKGYIIDCMAEFLKKYFDNFLIDGGGDMRACGHNKRGISWRIDVENAHQKTLLLSLSNQSLATSGITRRKWSHCGRPVHHLINPKNPEHFNHDILSVTVITREAEYADYLAKTLFLRGEERGFSYAEKSHIAALFLRNNGTVLLTEAMLPFCVS